MPRMRRHSRYRFPIATLFCVAIFIGVLDVEATATPRCALLLTDLRFRVALWNAEPCDGECLAETQKHFEGLAPWISLGQIDSEGIEKGDLKDFDAVLIPGGYMSQYGRALGRKGLKQIKTFVENGGIYVGTCAGAYLVSESRYQGLRLLPGLRGEVSYGRGMSTMELSPLGRSLISNPNVPVEIKYVNGPSLLIRESSTVDILAWFGSYRTLPAKPQDHPTNEGPVPLSVAALRSDYGAGAVILFSPHPELSAPFDELLSNALIAELMK